MAGRGKKQKYDKNTRGHEEWLKFKREDRPYQQYNPETKTWSKILLPKKVTQ